MDAAEPTVAHVAVETRRFGKPVTTIDGLDDRRDLPDLLRHLKQRLATGGATKDGRIELQGDHRRRATELLQAYGIRVRA